MAINTAPVLDPSGDMTLSAIAEDSASNTGNTVAVIIGTSSANNNNAITDVDSGAVEGIAITGIATANGTWEYYKGSGQWKQITSVADSAALLLAATYSIRFIPTQDFNGTVTGGITFRAWDATSGTAGKTADTTTNGGTTAFSTATETASITVNPVNDAPVLDNSGTMVLSAINEDNTASAGNTVEQIIASSAANSSNAITDVDSGAVEGIAIAGVTDTNGTWQYQTSTNGAWANLSAVIGNNAHLLLTAAGSIRFVPNADYNGNTTGNITFRAWDTTNGTAAGSTMDTSPSNGGTTAFSTATETATITINPVNDAPVLDNTGTMTLSEIDEDNTSNAGNTVGQIIASSSANKSNAITDIDSGASEGLAITAIDTTKGAWQYKIGTGAWTTLSSAADNSALLLAATDSIRFVPAQDYSGTVANGITFRAWDTTGGAAGSTADTTTNGGVTAFSTATETASITIKSVNDAPTLTGFTTTATTNEDTSITIASSDLIGWGNEADVDGTVSAFVVDGVSGGTLTIGSKAWDSKNNNTIDGNNAAKWTPPANSNGSLNAFTVKAKDDLGLLSSTAISVPVDVTAVNDPPSMIGLPTSITVTEDTAGNVDLSAATFADVDAGSNAIALTIAAGKGTLTASGSGGVTISGTATSTLTLTGTASAIDAYLDTASNIKYTGAADTFGSSITTLTLTGNDNGHTGTGSGGNTALGSVGINITAVGDTPSVTNAVTNEDTQSATGLVLSRNANDDNEVTHFKITNISGGILYQNNGSAKINDGDFITVSQGNAGLKFTPALNSTVSGSFNIQAGTDNKGNGLSSSSATASITINAINDAPVRTAGSLSAIGINEDSANTAAVSLGLSSVTYGPGGGSDESSQTLTYTITAIPSFITLYKNSGAAAVSVNGTLTAAELQGLAYKTAADANGNGNLTWTVTDSGSGTSPNANTLTENLSVTVNAVNDAPVRTAGSLTAISINEDSANTAAVSLGLSSVTYGPGGGSDESSQTLTYTITAIPSFITLYKNNGNIAVSVNETLTAAELQGLAYKTVADANGSGNLTWTVTDGGSGTSPNANTLTESLSVTVSGAPPPSGGGGSSSPSSIIASIDGIAVTSLNEADGSTTITIPIVSSARQDDPTSSFRNADIPLVKNDQGNSILAISLPAGVGLSMNGRVQAQSGQNAINDLIRRIEQKAQLTNNEQQGMITHGKSFLAALAPDETIVVQTITPTVSNNKAPQTPIIITGSNNDSDPKQALVIDVSNLPPGTVLQLDNVAFASIIGEIRAVGGIGENFAGGDGRSQFIVLGASDDVLFGGDGDDTVGSLGGDDQASGDAGDDIVFGGSGNDQISGGSGSDQLNGGLGFDRAVQAGALADYQFVGQDDSIILTNSIGETDVFTDIELIRFDTGPSLAIAYTEIEAVAHHLVKTWFKRDLTAAEGSAVQNWTDATIDNILTAFYSLPEAIGSQDKTPDQLLTGLETNPYIVRLDVMRDLVGSDDNDQGYLPLGLALNADGGEGHDVLRMTGSREDVHLEFVNDSLELTRLSDGAMLSLKNAEAIAFDSGETVLFAHNPTEAVLGRLAHSFFNRDATVEEWQQGREILDAQIDPQIILNWFRQNSGMNDLSDTDYVQTLFVQTLGRQASDNELNFYLNRLESDQVDRDQLAVVIANSQEAAVYLSGSVILQENWV